MKRILKLTVCIVLALTFLLALASCGDDSEKGIWKDATYTEDTELGSGAVTFTLDVEADNKTVTFTIHTDKTTVGEALLEHNLIAGSNGLYTTVNGMTAVWEVDNSYWAFYVDGKYDNNGMDATVISTSSVYKLEYTN